MHDDIQPTPTLRRVPRALVIIGWAICPPVAFISTLIRESLAAWWTAWNRAVQEVESGKSAWRGEREWR